MAALDAHSLYKASSGKQIGPYLVVLARQSWFPPVMRGVCRMTVTESSSGKKVHRDGEGQLSASGCDFVPCMKTWCD